jgi:predicted secreted protein
MASPAKAGYECKVMVGTDEIGWVKDWSVDMSRDTIETTHMNDGQDGWRTYIYGLGSGTVSVTVCWAMEDKTLAKQGQKALQDAWFAGKDPVVIKEYVDDTNFYASYVLVTGVSPTASVDGLVECSFTGQITGRPTYNAEPVAPGV